MCSFTVSYVGDMYAEGYSKRWNFVPSPLVESEITTTPISREEFEALRQDVAELQKAVNSRQDIGGLGHGYKN